MWEENEIRIPGRPPFQSEVDEELEFHLQMMLEDLEAGGLTPGEARRRAEEVFGDMEATRRYCQKQDRIRRRRRRVGRLYRSILDEMVLAARTLIRRPRGVVAPILILALAVALNALVLSVVQSVLLAPLPFQEADRVVVAQEVADNGGISLASYPVLDAWKREARMVERLAAYIETRRPAMTGSGPTHLDGAAVTSGFFEIMTDPIRVGRGFSPGEHAPGGPKVVVISEGLWQRLFGRDPAVLDRTLTLEGVDHQVVGIVRDEAAFPDGSEIWLPVESAAPGLLDVAGAKIFVALAQLRPGTLPGELHGELGEISARVPGGAAEATTVPVEDRLLGDVRTPLLLLQGAVLLVLLAAAVNSGSILLARGVRRRGEVALRASLGAGAARVASGLILEGLVLGGVAGVVGLLLATLTLGPALALVPVELPRAANVALDPMVAFRAMLLATATGVATSLLPALTGSRASPSSALREWSHGGGTPPWIRGTLEGFVVTQVALAVVLTAGAGLLVRSFISTIQEDPGFDPAGVTLLDVSLPELRYPDEGSRLRFARELLSGADGLSGAQEVALGRNLPISGSTMTSPLLVEGSLGMTEAVQVAMVTADYFRVLGIPFLEGGGFGGDDRVGGPPRIIVDSGVSAPEGRPLVLGDRAHSFFGNQDFRDVVGIVGAVRHRGLRSSPTPIAYEPFFQKGGESGFTLLIRSGAPVGVVVPEARALVRRLDPELAVDRVGTMDERISHSLAEPRFYTVVLSTFGALALVLALAGCQAGLAHRVAARRREMGIRMALGAKSRSIRGMVLRRGLLLTGGGLFLGLAASVPATRLLESQLYGVTAGDPLTLGGLLLLLLVGGAMAADLPARQAAALDPADVLREG